MTEDNAPQIVAELRKWASLWADLLHVDMTLLGLRETPNTPSTVFVRRSLWEAAVIAYGRMTMSNRARKVDFDDLLSMAGDREDSAPWSGGLRIGSAVHVAINESR